MWRVVTAIAMAMALGPLLPAPAVAGDEIVIGQQCDRSGPAAVAGPAFCLGLHDYIRLVNARGGVEGHRLRVSEVDTASSATAALEGYARQKTEGAVLIGLQGAAQTYALARRLAEDRIPGTAPGFGPGTARDGLRYPYLFPLAATYSSQAAAAVRFVKDQLGDLRGRKLAYLFFDDPAGREPLPLLDDIADREGCQLRAFPVAPPGADMAVPVLEIVRRYRADYIITHLFGPAPAVSIRELRRLQFPLRRVVSLASGAAESVVDAAGGWAAAEGYRAMQLAGVGPDYPVLAEIREMHRREGKAPPAETTSTVLYNRGVVIGALHVEAIRNALKARPDGRITGRDVKDGFEAIQRFTLEGLAPPIRITPEDHEGGGLVQIWEVRAGRFVRMTDWIKGYADLVDKRTRS